MIAAICAIGLPAGGRELPLTKADILAGHVEQADRLWRTVSAGNKRYGVRSLFSAMLAYTEANTNLNRVAVFIDKAAALQQRDAGKRGYGNFYWYSDESEVFDANAVDFCMLHAALVWRFHRDKLDPASRKRFLEMITLGLEGLLDHTPPPTYTNIALMNAVDLILLGEALEDPGAVTTGAQRLDLFLLTMWEQGIHEYTSPTYYGVNMESVLLLEALTKNAAIRAKAAVILKLFEHDIALNRYHSHDTIAGTCSRTYDFLTKQGSLDHILVSFGWEKLPLPADPRRFRVDYFSPLYSGHRPAPETLALSSRLPRTVRQRWGFTTRSSRTHFICRDVTLGTSASIYGMMDIPLSVDLPDSGEQREVQLYFLPDGRDDPYGKNRIAAGNHSKALHLTPWWAAAQHENEALAMVLYDAGTFRHVADKLQSHIVFRKQLDGIFIDNQAIDPGDLKAAPRKLNPDQTLFLREGGAAVALRIAWAQGQGRSKAEIVLTDDGNRYGALRLSVNHEILSLDATSSHECAGAVVRVRTGSGITTDEEFAEFRRQFISREVRVTRTNGGIQASLETDGQRLSLETASLVSPGKALIMPQPSGAVLEVDGEDIGRRILEEIPVVREYVENRKTPVPIKITPDNPTTWPAAAGGFSIPLEKGNDNDREYLWVPEEDGRRNWNGGAATWTLKLPEAGTYRIEAEIIAPTPEDDSFYVSAADSDDNEIIREFDWHTDRTKSWSWSTVTDRNRRPFGQSFDLPAGEIRLTFRTREAGIRLARLRLTPL